MAATEGADACGSVPGEPVARWTIGFFAPMVSGYYFGRLLSGVVEASTRGRGRVIAIQTADAGKGRDSFIDKPYASRAAWDHLDAFVVVLDGLTDAYIRDLHRTGKPLVLISREVPDLAVPVVVPDSEAGIAAVVEHLVGHGHRRIAFAGRFPDCSDDDDRLAAYRNAMLTHGLEPCETAPIAWAGEEISAAATARQLLSADERPTAVVVSTDVTAILLIAALSEAGVGVPGEIAVVGFDDIEDAARHRPPLSTVAQSFPLIGELAGRLVLQALEGRPPEPGHHLAPVSFIARESCGCPGLNAAEASAATGGSAADRFALQLLAAMRDSGELDQDGSLDVTGLISGLYDHGGLNQARLRDLWSLADRTVGLFTAVSRAPDADVSSAAASVATAIYQLVPQDRHTPQVSALLRQLARTLATELGLADGAGMRRLDDLAYDLSTTIFELHMRDRPAEYQYFQRQLAHYEISTDLMRRRNRNSRSLEWLAQTGIRAGCLSIRDGGGERDAGTGALTVVDAYQERGVCQAVGERCGERAFPPRCVLDLLDDHPADLVYLLSVRFDGSDWGLLALVGPLQGLNQTTLEMCNHWLVLLTVALDYERAVASLVNQREHLAAAYERERALTEEIRISEERYALAADAANDGLWDWDVAAGTTYYSSRWKSLLGYGDDEIGTGVDEWFGRVHPEDRSVLEQVIAQQLDGRAATLELEYRIRPGSGGYRWMLTRARAVHDERGRVVRLVGSMTDITDRKLLEDQLRHDARYDVLTGLPNRTLLLDRLDQAIEHARCTPGYWFAVVFLDLDGFKVINDSLGHQVGDQVLVQVAARLAGEMRADDTVSRFGGDEFVVLVGGVRAVCDLSSTVDRILAALATPLTLGERTVVVSACAGIAVSLTGYRTADEFIRDADTAMYRAKAIGNGTSMLFDESMHTGAVVRLQLESDLRRAIADGQFELYYQPIVALDTRRAVGFEALIRWNHPRRGTVSPAEFLPVAETTGLITQIGRWTAGETCRQLRHWYGAAGVGTDFTVSVNLSNRQFWDPELRSYLHRALRDHGVPASALVIEVTEGVIMHNPEVAGGLLRQLHDDGFRLHIDDFGTGYSSLEVLHTFPIDALKIDRSFVARITTDERSRELVRTMIAMGGNLGLEVVAEGIEDEEQAAALRHLGCPMVQGYLFSRPVTAGEASRFLACGESTFPLAA